MRYIVFAAVIAILTQLVPLAVAWFRIRALRVRAVVRFERVDLDALPAELAPVFDAAAAQLGELGFEPSHALWADALMTNEQRRPERVFVHPATATYAAVFPAIFHNGRRLYAVSFATTFRSGHALVTVDAMQHLSPLQVPGHEWRDHYLNDVVRQWHEHERAVLERAATDPPLRLSPDEHAARETTAVAAAIEAGRRDGLLGPPAHGAYRFMPRAAWFAARTLVAGTRRVEKMERAAAATKPLVSEVSLAADLYAFEMAEAQRAAAALPSKMKMRWLIGSAAVSAVALALIVSWSFVPALLLVLLIHELGHVAGMRLFGYRDRQILFLPFIGAAAIGTKEDATPFQRIVILLLGPVPGILIGLLCVATAAATGWSWLNELGLLFLLLNYLNLLPVTPLDGGRVVELLFLQRTPRAAAAFLLASAVAAGLAGLALDDLLLLGLSVLLLLSLPARWRIGAAALGALRRVGPQASRVERVRAAFLALDRTGRVASGARIQLARAVVEHLTAPVAPAYLAFAGGALYALLLAAPIVATTVVLIPERSLAELCPSGDDAATVTHELGHALGEVCSNAGFREGDARTQWNELVDRGSRSLADGDSTLAMQYFRLAHTAAVFGFGDDDPRRVATRRMIQDLVAAEDARAMATTARSETETSGGSEQ